MESTDLGWRALLRRQWPLACALVFFLASELFSEQGSWWQAPGSVVVAVLAVLAPRRPFDAALAAATAVAASSVVLLVAGTAAGVPVVSGLVISETAAVMAITAVAVRQASPVRAVVSVVVLVAVSAATLWVRPNYWAAEWPDYRPELWQQLFGGGVLLALSVGTGLYFRARDRERSTAVRAEVVAAQHAERMALARELHDVVAHYVTGIVVHAQAAQAVPAAAQEVLPIIVHSGNEALTAMRRLVGTLRGAEADAPAPAATSDLADDVRGVVAESDQPVRLRLDLPVAVPPSLGRSVLRLVQESLTNSRKHAGGVSRVDVSVTVADGQVHVVVADDGRERRAAPVGGSGGYGLIGMRERVELLGGEFGAGPRAGGGWEVRASLPIGG
ncbi:sensor histidine kinase [Saccharothrix lopnurensis]|uniref:histidine kinase n=1 Tax=Saccharothrix lopnurensis TaxID=1670621 RepID=A0ABW1PJ58_9PSEU